MKYIRQNKAKTHTPGNVSNKYIKLPQIKNRNLYEGRKDLFSQKIENCYLYSANIQEDQFKSFF